MAHSAEFVAICEEARSRVAEMELHELLARREQLLLIDVREDREWQAGSMPGSVHLGRGVLERDVVAHVPDKSTELVLYCGGGYRSALAAESLSRMGYTKVWSLVGGIKGWWRSAQAKK
jgi:rhodanese-related sulfurtransferase